jgi:hypothetical protein
MRHKRRKDRWKRLVGRKQSESLWKDLNETRWVLALNREVSSGICSALMMLHLALTYLCDRVPHRMFTGFDIPEFVESAYDLPLNVFAELVLADKVLLGVIDLA